MISRREAILRGCSFIGWGCLVSTCALGMRETVQFFVPRVIFQPPTRFTISAIDEFISDAGADAYGVIAVDTRWRTERRFFIVRERTMIYAVSARCTHLGCSINWFEQERIFRCPCHGSGYRSNGINFSGPAPRRLDRFRIELSTEHRIIVDTGVVYSVERFGADGAYINVN